MTTPPADEKPTFREVCLVAIMVAALLVHTANHLEPALHPGKGFLPFIAIPLAGAVFCVADCLFLIGWRFTLVAVVVTMVLSWTAEQLGVVTGMIFGIYEYGTVLGPWLGNVPYVIPVYWFMIIYVSYVITNLIGHDTPAGRSTSIPHAFWLAGMGALVATAYDLGLDPYMSSPNVKAWTWKEPGDYYGVPVHNFLGWIAVAFGISLILRLIHLWIGSRPLGRVTRPVALLPVLFYIGFWLGHMTDTYLPPLRVISLIALGIPAMAALVNYQRWIPPHPTPSRRAASP